VSSLDMTVTPEPGHYPPRVRIDVATTGNDPTITSVVITRIDPDGRYREVRTGDAGALTVSGGSASVYDYEAPFASPVTYWFSQYNGTPLEISQLGPKTTTVDVDTPWLIHVGAPTLSVPLLVSEFREQIRVAERGVFQILGRSNPVVVNGSARTAPAGVLGVRTKTTAERNALDTLLDDGSTLLLNIPSSLDWGMGSCYVAIGDVTVARTVDYAAQPWREWVLPYQVVGRPAGGTQAAISWNTVVGQYTSWADVAASVDSWAELVAPTG
jgi:hypothetical protein